MKYSRELAERFGDMMATGQHRIQDICSHVGISEQTLSRWKKDNSEFCEIIKEAETRRLKNLGELALSGLALLLSKHEVEEVTIEYQDNGLGAPKPKSKKVVKKTIMPNPAAVIFTVKNRMGDDWKDESVQKVELSALDKVNFSIKTRAPEIE